MDLNTAVAEHAANHRKYVVLDTLIALRPYLDEEDREDLNLIAERIAQRIESEIIPTPSLLTD